MTVHRRGRAGSIELDAPNEWSVSPGRDSHGRSKWARWFRGGIEFVAIGDRIFTVRRSKEFSWINGRVYAVSESDERRDSAPSQSSGEIRSPMPGRVVAVVADGTSVEAGASVVVIESMKMEMSLNAPVGGTVRIRGVSVGALVAAGAVLAEVVRS